MKRTVVISEPSNGVIYGVVQYVPRWGFTFSQDFLTTTKEIEKSVGKRYFRFDRTIDNLREMGWDIVVLDTDLEIFVDL